MDKKVYKRFFNNFGVTLKFSGIITLILVIVYVLLYFLNGLLQTSLANFILNPFIGLIDLIIAIFILSLCISILSPFLFSLNNQTVLSILEDEKKVRFEPTIKSFFNTYFAGATGNRRGALRVFNTLLISILIYLGLAIIGYLIVGGIYASNNIGGFSDLLIEIQAIFNSWTPNSDTTEIYTQLNEIISSSRFINVFNEINLYSNFVGLLAGFYYFLHQISYNALKYHFIVAYPTLNKRVVNNIYKVIMRGELKKNYQINFYKTLFPITILVIVSFTLSYFLFSLVPLFSNNIYVLALTAFIVTIVLVIPFIPLVFGYNFKYWEDNNHKFLARYIELAKQEINTVKLRSEQMANIDQAQINEYEKSIKEMEKALMDKDEEENKENTDDKNDDENHNNE